MLLTKSQTWRCEKAEFFFFTNHRDHERSHSLLSLNNLSSNSGMKTRGPQGTRVSSQDMSVEDRTEWKQARVAERRSSHRSRERQRSKRSDRPRVDDAGMHDIVRRRVLRNWLSDRTWRSLGSRSSSRMYIHTYVSASS